ncbi:MAG: HK97 gp10 family phage protein [Oscillospiraceae bacterium]|nr:HK97 gp10 family phage protein [Oscillospiraceae bacterium]
MANVVSVSAIAEEITGQLDNYSDKVAEAVKDAVDTVTKELVSNTRADAPKRTGNYRKSISSKTTSNSTFGKTKLWYVKTPGRYYSHLLENGHAKIGGGRVAAIPHIEPNVEKAKEELTKLIKEAIENG